VKTYRGYRLYTPAPFEGVVSMSVKVTVEQKGHEYDLPLRRDLYDHSPTGFEWGYAGSGPAQLALALLGDTMSSWRARALHQDFKTAVVAKFPEDGWILTEKQVKDHVRQLIAARKKGAQDEQ
jgi:hypothetical protein